MLDSAENLSKIQSIMSPKSQTKKISLPKEEKKERDPNQVPKIVKSGSRLLEMREKSKSKSRTRKQY